VAEKAERDMPSDVKARPPATALSFPRNFLLVVVLAIP
jgi:hypothetical protein